MNLGRHSVSSTGQRLTSPLAWWMHADRPRCVEHSVSEETELASAYTFDNPDLLRGSHIADLLKNDGRIFKESKGDACTYELSKRVAEIEVFISHNWSTPANRKVQALSLYFNWKAAVIGASMTTIVLILLVYFVHILPIPTFLTWKGKKRSQGPYCLVLSNSVFFLILHFWQDVSAFARVRGAIAFLDKTCIHQTDPELKRQGISMLAGFLANSHSMLVVYTDEYLQKLWTVYELASFLVLHTQHRMVVMPLLIPRLVWICTICCILCSTADYIQAVFRTQNEQAPDGSHFANYLVQSAPTIPLTFMLQAWTQDLANIAVRVKNFSLANAKCFDESDRPVVQRNIAAFMRDMKLVMPDATENQALGVFDYMVRTQVPQYLKASFGRSGIPYRKIFIRLLTGITTTFFVRPCVFAVIFRLVRLTAGFSRFGRCMCVLPITIFALGMSMFFRRILNQLEMNSLEEYKALENLPKGLRPFPWDLATYCMFSLYLAVLTLLFYLPVTIPKQKDLMPLSTEDSPTRRSERAFEDRSGDAELVNCLNIELQSIGVSAQPSQNV